jgi:zinc transporter ZupT
MALALGFAAFLATLLGGSFALKYRDQLHLILGFSSDAEHGVALFDLLPESLDLTAERYSTATVTLLVAVGFFAFMFLSRVLLLHPESEEDELDHGHAHAAGALGAASLSLHSFLDGVGIGLAVTFAFGLSDVHLGLVLSLFCGFFLYLGASDLLPESHHRHPKLLTGVMNIAGAAVIWLTVHFATL